MEKRRKHNMYRWFLLSVLCFALLGCGPSQPEESRDEESRTEENMGINSGIGGILKDDEDTEESSGLAADVTPGSDEETTEESTEETTEETTEEITEPPTTEPPTTEPPTTEPPTAGNTGDFCFQPDLGPIAALPNTSKGWGPGKELDKTGRPAGAVQYQNRYGKYDADFVGEAEKKIYLTLDEGYENGYTGAILDVLREKQVSAVFFVTKSYARQQPALVRRMINEGHVVGAHSVTHPADGMPSLSLEKQLSELRDLHEYMLQEFGYEMYLFRYPAGIFSEQSLALVQATGYRSVFWSFAYQDWLVDNQMPPAQALEKTLGSLHPGAIYLLHAVSSTNTAIMGDFIDGARAAGYEFAKYERK